MEVIQKDIPSVNWDFSFVNYHRKAYECAKSTQNREASWIEWQHGEAIKDFYTDSITEIKHLIQFDQTPNLELKEPKWEIYKISISFPFIGNFLNKNSHSLTVLKNTLL